MAYSPYYSPWVDAAYDSSGNLVTPSPTPATAAAFSWWDTNLAKALPQTTKGDLAVYDGSNPVRQAVGPRGAILTADPTTATGVSWGSQLYTPVTNYGATGDGTTDDTAAIQNALNSVGPGGTVYFPDPSGGSYRVSAPIDVPPNITLLGQHTDTLQYTGASPSPNSIKPLPSFTSGAVFTLRDKTTTGSSVDYVGTRIENLTIDGSAMTSGAVTGIQLTGLVRECTFTNVTVRDATAAGFLCTINTNNVGPQSLRFRGCVTHGVSAHGFQFVNVADSTMIDCNAEGSGGSGYYISGFINGVMIGCRAEWSGAYGYTINSGWWASGQGSGGMNMLGCTSDRNAFDGAYINASGAAQIQITGCTFRRDGSAGGTTYAAVRVDTTTMPVIINNIGVYPGVNDDGTGTLSPYAGVSAIASTSVKVNSGYLHAATTPVVDGGTNGVFALSPTIGAATGSGSSPTRLKPAERVNTVAASGTTQTLPDPASYPMSDVTLTGNCTFTFPTPRAGTRFTLGLHQDATGGRTVTWPANTIVKWPSGTAPTLITTANATNVLNFVCTAGVWIGSTVALGAA